CSLRKPAGNSARRISSRPTILRRPPTRRAKAMGAVRIVPVAHSSWLALAAERDRLQERINVLEAGAERRRAASVGANAARAAKVEQRRTFTAAFATASRWQDPHRQRTDSAVRQIVREHLFVHGHDVSADTVRRDILATLGPSPKK